MNKTTKFFFAILIFFCLNKFSYANTNDSASPITFQQGIFHFSIENDINLKKFARRISLRKIAKIPGTSVNNLPSTLNKQYKEIFYKFYVIYARVQSLLNMHPKRLKRLNISVHKNLKNIKLNNKNILHRKKAAFYDPKTVTIYISAKKCDEYILAHEMAHAVISKFFLVVPPANTQEILAVYCDTHLKDDFDYLSVK